MNNGTAANAVYGDTVDQISLSVNQVGANRSGKETQGKGFYRWVAEQSDIKPDTKGLIHWQECYRDLWQLKLSFEKEHNR